MNCRLRCIASIRTTPPFTIRSAELLIEMVPSPPRTTDLEFIAVASERVASAAREALTKLQPLTHVACGKGKVEKFASNRRVPLPDGKIGIRLSHCNDPVLIAAPEGLIDPWMRTISLFNRQRPIARLHYYAIASAKLLRPWPHESRYDGNCPRAPRQRGGNHADLF